MKRRGNNEGSIRQRADGRWEGRISLPNGKRPSFYGDTKAAVQAQIRAAQRSVEDGIDVSAGKITVKQFLEKWLVASAKPSVRTRTYENYESMVRIRVVPRIGAKQLAKITPLDLQALYAELAECGLSSRSILHTHRVLHLAFRQAVRWNLLSRNPCDGAKAPRPSRTEMTALDQEQVNRLVAGTRDRPAHALYVLAVTTGMRIGELMGLRWDDVDLDTRKLVVKRSLQRQNEAGLVFVEPKTSRSRRTIVIGKHTVGVLRRHRAQQLERRLQLGPEWRDQGLVFCNAAGGPSDPSWQREVFKALLKELGLPAIRFHDLRHTAASLLLSKGVNVKFVSEMLGHSSISLTLDTYSHLLPAMHAQAADAWDQMLGT